MSLPLKGASWQISKLQSYLARPDIVGSESYTVRTTARHHADQVLDALRRHLRAHRLRVIVVKNHNRLAVPSSARRGRAPSVALPATPAAGSQPTLQTPGGSAPVPSGRGLPTPRIPISIAGWSTWRRLEVLLEDPLLLLGRDLQAHILAMLTGEALTQLLAGFVLMAGLQAIPGVGEAVDAVFLGMALTYAGWDGLRAIARLVHAARSAVAAGTAAEIAAAAPKTATADGAGRRLLRRHDPARRKVEYQRRNGSGRGRAGSGTDRQS